MQDDWHSLSSVIGGLYTARRGFPTFGARILRNASRPAFRGNPSSLQNALAKRMDPRVKPAGDAGEWVSAEPIRAGTAAARAALQIGRRGRPVADMRLICH